MTQKYKKNKNNLTVGRSLGLAVMTLAAVVSLVEIPEHNLKPAVIAPALASVIEEVRGPNPERREREEAGPHYVSYSANQRTPSRSGQF